LKTLAFGSAEVIMGLFDWLFGKPSSGSTPHCGSDEAESKDADLVDEAVQLIGDGKRDRATRILHEVLNRTPSNYRHEDESNGKARIRFWDMEEFMTYVLWMKENGREREVIWSKNAYPRASYYLGFIYVEQKRFDRAIEVLERGIALQPDSGKLAHELGQALIGSGRFEKALSMYGVVLSRSGFMCPRDRAALLRGKGFVLIETRKLDEAEASFRESLVHDPDSHLARSELMHIAELRSRLGDIQAPVREFLRRSPTPSDHKCEQCGCPIPLERLAMIPNATRCLSCQMEIEKQ
jgi:tetratricopeptide (TPR) repeat protein